jgi:DNA gyrase subunit A
MDGDQLIEARLTSGTCEVMIAIKSGRAIRFPEDKVRTTGRGAIGVFGIEVDNEKDEVVGMVCVNKDDASRTILVVSEKGFGKRTSVEEYRITNRGGKGVKTINVTEKTGSLVGILDVNGKEDLVITCKSGVTIRTSIGEIREAGRATQGVKLIRIDEGDEIAAISKIQEQEEAIVLTEASLAAEAEALDKLEEAAGEETVVNLTNDTSKTDETDFEKNDEDHNITNTENE